MTVPPRKDTMSSRVLADLRAEILRADLAPGARINLDRLRAARGISISPLREALARLTADGLVLFEDQRGFRVAPVSRAEFADIAALRRDLHCTALAAAIAGGDMDWESGVVRALHRLTRVADDAPAADRAAAQDDFLAALIAGAGRPLLLQTCARLSELASRYRHLAAAPPDIAADRAEQEQIAQAATSRRSDAACTELRAHLQRTDAAILARLPADLPAT